MRSYPCKSIFLFVKVSTVVLLFMLCSGLAFATPRGAPANDGKGNPAMTDNALLQFTSGGHVLGFESDHVYMAGLGYALVETFVDASRVTPQADETSWKRSNPSPNGAKPLQKFIYADLWEGITAIYTPAANGLVESTYIVDAGADPGRIRVRYNAGFEVTRNGCLRFNHPTGRGYFTLTAPIAWQEMGDRRQMVDVGFKTFGKDGVGFDLGGYDPGRTLFIDPTYQWHTFYGSEKTDYGNSIAVGPDGCIYVAGLSLKTWQGDGGASPLHGHSGGAEGANNEIIILKLDPAGAYQWHTFYGSGIGDEAYDIAVDANGGVYVTGKSANTWQGDNASAPNHSQSGGYDIVILKLDINGNYQWHTFYGSDGVDSGNSIAVDTDGNAYITGESYKTWQGDNTSAPNHGHGGSYDMVILKVDTAGVYQWHTFYGSASYDYGEGIAVDASGNPYITGNSNATWQGDGATDPLHAHSGGGKDDIAILKLTASGGYQWHTFYGSGDADQGYDVVVDTSGSLYITGRSNVTWQGDGATDPLHAHSSGGKDDIAILKLTANGAYQWHTFYGAGGLDYGNSIALDRDGNIFVTGRTEADWQGDGGAEPLHAYSGNSDIPILKLTSNGAYQWHTFYGAGAYDYGEGIAVGGGNQIYVSGHSSQDWQGDPAPALHAFVGQVGYYDIAVLKLSGSPCAMPFIPSLLLDE